MEREILPKYKILAATKRLVKVLMLKKNELASSYPVLVVKSLGLRENKIRISKNHKNKKKYK